MSRQLFVTALGLLCTINALTCLPYGPSRYSGYSLVRVIPQHAGHLDLLENLKITEAWPGIEFWTESIEIDSRVDIMVPPDIKDLLFDSLDRSGIPYEVVMKDIGAVIRATSNTSLRSGNLSRSALSPDEFHRRFQPYAAIERKLNDLADSNLIKVEAIGSSYEKRNLYLVKVSTNHTANKPVIFIDAGHHAREWISISTGLYILESLIQDRMPVIDEKSRTNPNLNISLDLDKYDFWFLPVVNPDGYEYSRIYDRLWRKTRSRSGFCMGVDPNRNYPFHWRESGSSSFSCDETYAGPKPLSEPETETVAKVLDENNKKIVMYLTLHAYSQLVLSPYGHKRIRPYNYEELEKVAKAWINAVGSVRGTKYSFGTSAILLYPAAGGSDDYAHGTANIKISLTIELPDTGSHGFLMPPNEIIPVGQEAVLGLRAMIDTL